MDDPRFSHVASDPRYKRVARKRHKVTVDSRFKSMFTDEKFKLNYRVDKRGKEINESSKEDLKRYYNLEEDEEEGEGREETMMERDQEGSGLDNSDDNNSDQEDDSGGSSTDVDYDALSNDNKIEYDWGDQTGEAERSHDTSERLAVCNMNWDRITAQDLFVLFNSFKPQNGVVTSVKIYVSEYGKERLANEEREGPAELVDNKDEEEGDNPDAIEGPDFAREKLRQYQLNRLKYYYAVVECNDKETAEHIYDQCDGLEYENSASTIDLRFVPVDTVFDEEPSSMATDVTIATDFTPSNFFTSALQQTSVNLTWDETDPSRLKKTMKSFTKEELDDIDFGAYIASSSDEGDQHNNGDAYRALLGAGKSDGGVDKEEMQISWNVGLEDEKKSKLKKGKNVKVKVTGDQSDKEDGGDLGFDDPFFTNANLTKKKRKKEKLTMQEKEQKEKEKSELELLMMSSDDEDGGRTHFSLKDITANEKKESGKKKRRKRKLDERDTTQKDEDDFTVDTADPRFQALYESHQYAVDPTNPQYKETKGMRMILQEKQKRSVSKRAKVSKEEPTAENSIGVLVKSVKAKAVSYMEKKRRKNQPLIS